MVHTGNLILKKLNEKDLSVAWLARQIDYDSSNLLKLLQRKDIPPELLRKICRGLRYNFFISLADDMDNELKIW